jgi:hypothetical protein
MMNATRPLRISSDADSTWKYKRKWQEATKDSSGSVSGNRKWTTCREASLNGKETQGCVRNSGMETNRGSLSAPLVFGLQ